MLDHELAEEQLACSRCSLPIMPSQHYFRLGRLAWHVEDETGRVALFSYNSAKDLFYITLNNDREQAALRVSMAEIPGTRWDNRFNFGEVRGTPANARLLLGLADSYRLEYGDLEKKQLFSLIERGQHNFIMSGLKAGVPSIAFPGLNGSLRPFQVVGAHLGLEHRRVLVADDMGLGKTIEAMAVMSVVGEPAIIVCPKNVTFNWQIELVKWMRNVKHSDIFQLKGTKRHKIPDVRFIILNYDILRAWIGPLLLMGRRMIVLDECHRVTNWSAARTQAAHKLIDSRYRDVLGLKSADWVLALSGTPLTSWPKQMVTLLKVLGRVDEIGGEQYARKMYCFKPETDYEDELLEGRLETLNEHMRMAGIIIRRRKTDVLDELPDKTRQIVPLQIDLREYSTADNDFRAWVKRMNAMHVGGKEAWTEEATRQGLLSMGTDQELAQIQKYKDFPIAFAGMSRINTLKQLALIGKLPLFYDWVENDFLPTGGKIVIGAWFRQTQDILEARWPTEMVTSILGKHNPREREEHRQRFIHDPNCRILVVSIAAASEGINLQEAASTTATVEFGWTPAQHEQLEDRVHRIGQVNPVTSYYFPALGTVEVEIAELLDQRLQMTARVVDGRDARRQPIIGSLIQGLMDKDTTWTSTGNS